jgi:hypothetical protein
MSTRDLIDAITSGDATGVEASFNTIMAAKVSDKIDSMRNDVAQNMFATPEELDVEETETVDSEDFEDSEYEDEETVEETEEENE